MEILACFDKDKSTFSRKNMKQPQVNREMHTVNLWLEIKRLDTSADDRLLTLPCTTVYKRKVYILYRY